MRRRRPRRVHRRDPRAWWGSRAAARPPSAASCCACSSPTPGTIRFDGRDLLAATGADLRRLRSRDADRVPGPLRVARPAATVGDSIAEGLASRASPSRSAQERVDAAMALVGPRAVPRPALPASVQRRSAPAHRHRPGPGRRAPLPGGRRAGVGARRVDPVADPQPAARPAGRLNLTLLFVAHDLSVVEHLCDRVAVMYLGRIVELGTPRRRVRAPPATPTPGRCCRPCPCPIPSWPPARPDRADRRPAVAANPPSGCRFHTRCPFVRPARCHDEVPELRELRPGHSVACHWAEEIVADAVRRERRVASRPRPTVDGASVLGRILYP